MTAGGQQGRIQILLLSADNQRLEPAAYINHQQPDHPGTQGRPSLPASHTPSSLDPLKLYIVLTGDVGEFYLFLSCVAVFTQGKLQSPKKIYTLQWKKKKKKAYILQSNIALLALVSMEPGENDVINARHRCARLWPTMNVLQQL